MPLKWQTIKINMNCDSPLKIIGFYLSDLRLAACIVDVTLANVDLEEFLVRGLKVLGDSLAKPGLVHSRKTVCTAHVEQISNLELHKNITR